MVCKIPAGLWFSLFASFPAGWARTKCHHKLISVNGLAEHFRWAQLILVAVEVILSGFVWCYVVKCVGWEAKRGSCIFRFPGFHGFQQSPSAAMLSLLPVKSSKITFSESLDERIFPGFRVSRWGRVKVYIRILARCKGKDSPPARGSDCS